MDDTQGSAADSWIAEGWSLDALMASRAKADVDAEMAAVESRIEEFAATRSELETLDAARLVELIATYEGMQRDVSRLMAFASLWFSEDTQSEDALDCRNRLQAAMTQAANKTLFFGLWWQSLDDERADELLGGVAEANADYAFYLEDQRRTARYRLDEAAEKIVNLKNADGISAVMTLYSLVTNAFQFRPRPGSDAAADEDVRWTRDQLTTLALSADPEDREWSYRELYRVYGEQRAVLGQMYVNRVRDWSSEYLELRGYGSPISVRNVANDVSDEAVDSLLEVIRERSGVFRDFFRLKASWLGQEKLRRYDIYAPLRASDRRVEYGDAVELVLDTFGSFDARVGDQARRVFTERHIDVPPRAGKRGGAFCASPLPDVTPWVLVNYDGTMRDVATLAHEMGHAIHSMLAEEHSILTHHPCLPLAETASVFAEMLITERLLEEESDDAARREIIATSMDDMYATIARQAYFVVFELEAHAAVAQGASMGDLEQIYLDTLREQFGDAVEVSDEFRGEWMAIPHIYAVPFYCYAYSFGQLLVLALYQRYREEGEAFKPGYLRLLSYGGSQRPETALAELGIDPRDKDFWRGGFAVLEDMLRQLS